MPSPDWMCRSELMLPPLRRLLARDDLEVRPTTLRAALLDGPDGPVAPGPDPLRETLAGFLPYV
jgi:hypothetical protein